MHEHSGDIKKEEEKGDDINKYKGEKLFSFTLSFSRTIPSIYRSTYKKNGPIERLDFSLQEKKASP